MNGRGRAPIRRAPHRRGVVLAAALTAARARRPARRVARWRATRRRRHRPPRPRSRRSASSVRPTRSPIRCRPHRSGALIAALVDRPAIPSVDAAQRSVFLYHSTDVSGHDVAVSGQLVVPRGTPPVGGWPVVSWAHGTSGIADRCTPSQHDFWDRENAQEVRTFVDAGYAVAATDYPGLGTPGIHPYLVGADEGNAVVDVVTAAHHLEPHLSATVVRRRTLTGRSSGAVRDAIGGTGRRRCTSAATVSMAPASSLDAILLAVVSLGAVSDQAYAIFAAHRPDHRSTRPSTCPRCSGRPAWPVCPSPSRPAASTRPMPRSVRSRRPSCFRHSSGPAGPPRRGAGPLRRSGRRGDGRTRARHPGDGRPRRPRPGHRRARRPPAQPARSGDGADLPRSRPRRRGRSVGVRPAGLVRRARRHPRPALCAPPHGPT